MIDVKRKHPVLTGCSFIGLNRNFTSAPSMQFRFLKNALSDAHNKRNLWWIVFKIFFDEILFPYISYW